MRKVFVIYEIQFVMKKILLVLLLMIGTTTVYSQSISNETTLFAQCIIDIDNPEEMKNLESEMRTNPYVKLVRLDGNTKRAFILTKSIDELSEENFISWFNQYSGSVSCIQIGLHGVDVVNPYPFTNCSN